MRKRKWALFAFISLLAFIFISLESWRLLKANEKLKDFILEEFRPIVGDELSISKVHVSFGNIHILDVRFQNPEKNVSIDIRDLRIGYNFFNLLVRGFHPQYISQDALFIGPTVTINSPDSLTDETEQLEAVAEKQPAFSSDFEELDLFSHISIKDGEIVYNQDDTTVISLVHSVQGGIYRLKGDSLFIDLDGAFFNSPDHNIRIVGDGDYRSKRISNINAALTDYEMKHGLPLVNKDVLDLRAGLLNGAIDIRWHEWKSRYEAEGLLSIRSGSAELFSGKLVADEVVADLRLEHDKIVIQESDLKINNSKVKISGELVHLTEPSLSLAVESNDLEISQFTSIIGHQFPADMSGVSRYRASVKGSLDRFVIYQNIRSKVLRMNNTALKEFYADVVFDGATIHVDSSSAIVHNNHLSLNGSVDMGSENKRIQGTISGYGDATPLLAAVQIDSSFSLSLNLRSNISGSLRRPVLTGVLYAETYSPVDSLLLEIFVDYRDKKMTLYSDSDLDGFSIRSTVDWRLSPPGIQAECKRAEQLFYYFFDVPAESYLAERVRSSITASGDLDDFLLKVNVFALSGGRVAGQLVDLEAGIERRKAVVKSDGTFLFNVESSHPTHGVFSVEKSPSAIHVKKLDIEDELTAFLNFDTKTRELTGTFESDKFDLARLMTSSDSLLAGNVDAAIKIGGTVDNPKIAGNVQINELFYRHLGPYETLLQFDYDDFQFGLERFTLDYGVSTLLYAHGQYDAISDSLDFSVKGAGFDAGHVLGAAGKDSVISGETLVDLTINGSAKSPNILGLAGIQNGHIFKLPFDEVELKLGPASEDEAFGAVPSIYIEKFRLSRFNVYEVLAHGTFPFSGSDSLYLDVNGRGNFLQILNDVQPFFQSPQGICSLQSRVRGTPTNPQLDEAYFTIDNASMEFRSVVAPISDVKGELAFNADEQFLHLSSLEGKMGDKPFLIYNELVENVVSSKPLRNLHIGDSDFHFGVLILQTPDKGVPLNFVGIMEPNEFGMLDLLGRESAEKFYFAGSPEGLTLRGRINLYDTEIMYPFYDGVQIGTGKLKDFLRNLVWDLLVVPTKNTRFVRNFPGAIDEVYVDLKLDESFGGLEFTDRLVNESFRINGHVRSTKGIIEYLDMDFRVEQAGVDFDRSSLIPVAYGHAKTTVTDSLGISSNIILTLQTVDNTMDKKSVDDIVRQEEGRARFDQIRFKLSSDNPNIGNNEAQILASLGYSSNNLQNSALSAIGYGTDNLIFRPLFRPVEKELEQTFGFDYVRFSSQLTRNIIMFNLNNNIELNSRLALLESTKIIVGKYLANRFFLQYTGQIESGVGYRYKEKHLGLHHTLGLEYQINPRVLVELEYDYDSLMLEKRDDKRIILRHWFPF